MLDLLLSGSAAWFGVPALLGTGVFILRLAMMLLGGHHAVDHPGDSAIDHAHPDSAAGFKALSFQSVVAFAMGFGWGGIGAFRGLDWPMRTAMLLGIACGVGMVWLLALLLKGLYDLQSSGNIRLDEALGREGVVYVSLPAAGTGRGQVKLVVSQRQRIYNAQSESAAAPTGSLVRVVGINGDNSLTVVPIGGTASA